MASRQKNTTRRVPLADDMAGGRGRENAILADQELLDTVGRADLGNQLDHLRVPVSAITADDKEGTCIGRVS